ncbi:RNaseH domain-containing protein [Streptomyces sp. NPDC020597]|uniref:RNaseH domain-containing protein n=1 Tax=unclassified Streptomyces TaxID=2593676 RepID=UPI0037A3AD89
MPSEEGRLPPERPRQLDPNALREILSGVGSTDHRFGAAFGKPPLESWWNIGIHVRRRQAQRHTPGKRRTTDPAPITATLTAMRPTGGKDAPWQVWAYNPQAWQWQPHSPATTALRAADPAWGVSGYRATADETLQARAATDIVEQALIAVRTQIPAPAPAMLYVDGDAAEYNWAGLSSSCNLRPISAVADRGSGSGGQDDGHGCVTGNTSALRRHLSGCRNCERPGTPGSLCRCGV